MTRTEKNAGSSDPSSCCGIYTSSGNKLGAGEWIRKERMFFFTNKKNASSHFYVPVVRYEIFFSKVWPLQVCHPPQERHASRPKAAELFVDFFVRQVGPESQDRDEHDAIRSNPSHIAPQLFLMDPYFFGAKWWVAWGRVCEKLGRNQRIPQDRDENDAIRKQPALHCPPALVMGSLLFLSKMLGRLGQKL